MSDEELLDKLLSTLPHLDSKDFQMLTLMIKILKISEFLTTSIFKEEDSIVEAYVNYLKPEGDEVLEELFELTESLLISEVTEVLEAMKNTNLIIIEDGVWKLTEEGITLYSISSRILYGEHKFN